MGLRAGAGVIPSPRRRPRAVSVVSNRKGAQAIGPMGVQYGPGSGRAVEGRPEAGRRTGRGDRPALGSVKVMPRRGRAQA